MKELWRKFRIHIPTDLMLLCRKGTVWGAGPEVTGRALPKEPHPQRKVPLDLVRPGAKEAADWEILMVIAGGKRSRWILKNWKFWKNLQYSFQTDFVF